MNIELITKFEDFLKFEKVWEKILGLTKSEYVCLTFEWFKAWWQSFGENKQLFVLSVKDHEEIIGLVPLISGRSYYRGIPIKEIKFMENENSPRVDFLISRKPEEALDAIFEFLKANQSNWDVIRINNIPKESPNFEIIQQSVKKLAMIFGVKKGYSSPYIKIDTNWDTYYSKLSRKFHKDLRNKVNRISRLGKYEIKKVESILDNKGILSKIFEISKKSWKNKIKKDISCTLANKKFFENLTEISSRNGWLNIWLLEIDGHPVSYEYKLLYKNSICGLRTDFDEEYKKSSPGLVLRKAVLKSVFEDNIKEVDMGPGENRYKENWTNNTREHAKILIFKKNFKGRLLYLVEFKVIIFIKRLISKKF